MRRARFFIFALILGFSTVVLLTQELSAGLKLIPAKGRVNLSEIGGGGLRVVSIWDDRKGLLVGTDGGFVTTISNQRPQKLSLVDNYKRTRGLAIALPQFADNIVFDAKSTALAVLFQDSSSFADSEEAENFCQQAQEKPSFRVLADYFKKNLPLKSLEELANNGEYISLLEECSVEILGQDHEAIRKSLKNAQKELEKFL